MKKMLALTALTALLSLALAACSQNGQTPAATAGHSIVANDPSHVIYADTQAAYDALVNADLQRLTSQVLAPQVYLNVLPIPGSPGSVKAYLKSTFAAPVVCGLTWGDSSVASSVQSPTTGRIETQNHTFTSYGLYTVTVTCLNNGAVVGTRSVTLRGGVRGTGASIIIDFDAPPAANSDYNSYTTYQEKGFSFTNSYGPLYQFGLNYGGPGTYNFGPSQNLYTYSDNSSMSLQAVDGTLFTLHSLDTRSVYRYDVADYTITGYRADGTTVTVQTHEVSDANSTVTFDSSWTDLSHVTFGIPGIQTDVLIDNVNLSQ